MERRVTISLRIPEDVHAELKRVADQEDRTITAQILRFIRTGIDQHLGRNALMGVFAAICDKRGWTFEQLAAEVNMTPEQLAILGEHQTPSITISGFVSGALGVRPDVLPTAMLTRASAINEDVNTTRLLELVKEEVLSKSLQ